MAELPIQTTPTVEVQVAPTGYSRSHFTPDDFGAGMGKELQKIGERIKEELHQDRMLKVAAAADEADLISAAKLGALQAEFHRKRGRDPSLSLEQHVQDIEAARQQAGKDLGPLARRMFEQQTRRRAEGMIVQSQEYAGRQMDQWMTTTRSLAHEDAKTQAGNLYSNPGKISELVREDMAKGGKLYEQVHGYHGDELAKAVHTDGIDVVEGALSGALAANTADGARSGTALLDSDLPGIGPVRAFIGGARAEKWEQAFKKNLGVAQGTDLAEEMRKKHGTNTEAGILELERRYAQKDDKGNRLITDEAFKHAKNEFTQTNSQIHTAREQRRTDNFRSVSSMIIDGSPKGPEVTVEAWLTRGTPAEQVGKARIWGQLDGQQQMNMRSMLAEHSANGAPTPANNAAYAELIDKVRTGEIDYTNDGGASRFTSEWGPRLHKNVYSGYMNYLMQVSSGSDKFAKVNEPVIKDVVSQVMGTLGISAKKPADRTPGEHAVTIEAFEEAKRGVKVWAKEHPGEPWPRSHVEGGKEMGYQSVIDKYIIKGAAPSKVFGSTDFWPDPITRAQAVATGRAWWYVPTPEEKSKIIADFRAANGGREPTAEELKIRAEIVGERKGASRVAPNSLNIPVVADTDNLD